MRVAFVTGASRGIGRATALRLARDGWAVGVNYLRDEEPAMDVVKTIEEMGGSALAVRADVADARAIGRAVEEVAETLGRISGVVCNAGIYMRRAFHEMTLEDWERTIDVNLTGAFNTVMATIPHLRRGGGSVVFVSSQLAFRGSSSSVAYSASKAGILGLMRGLVLQESHHGIRFNAVAPGTIDTDMISGYSEERRRARAREVPLGRIGRPEEVASVIAFLLSDESSYINGAVIDVNGGLYMR
jgi:3-oxoacyl-[acyl-carrier protein] reductase